MYKQWTLEEIRAARGYPNFHPALQLDDFLTIGMRLDAFHEDRTAPGVNPYHAEMVSKKHTQGFMNCSTILAHPNICEMVAAQMIKRAGLSPGDTDFVVGPGNAAITISYEIARQLGAIHGFTEKDDEGKPRKFGGRVQIAPGQRVLIANELMSTMDGSTLHAKQGVLMYQPQARILPFALVLFNRSGQHQLVDGTRVITEFDYPMPAWDPDHCPCCNSGSKAIKPKISRENWLRWKNAGRAA